MICPVRSNKKLTRPTWSRKLTFKIQSYILLSRVTGLDIPFFSSYIVYHPKSGIHVIIKKDFFFFLISLLYMVREILIGPILLKTQFAARARKNFVKLNKQKMMLKHVFFAHILFQILKTEPGLWPSLFPGSIFYPAENVSICR